MEYIDYLDKSQQTEDAAVESDEMIIAEMEQFHCVSAKEISDYHKKTILNGKCNAFVPVRCISEGEEIKIFYSIEDLIALEDYLEFYVSDFGSFLDVIVNTCDCILSAKEYLLYENEIIFMPGNVYADCKTGRIMMQYMPGKKASKTSFNSVIDLLKRHVSYSNTAKELRSQITSFTEVAASGCRNIEDLKKMTLQYSLSITSREEAKEEESGIIQRKSKKDDARNKAKTVMKRFLIKLVT